MASVRDVSEAIRVIGLRDFQRELRAMDKALPSELRKTNLSAAQIVAPEAQRRALAAGGAAAHVAPSIKAAAEQRNAIVQLGGRGYEMAMGAEFGGGKYGPGHPTAAGGHTTQFKSWRGRGHDAGYFMFPAARSKRDEVIGAYARMLEELAALAFPERSG